jgi:glyoxylase-like metal-dependent hydrolase (beta-lactamase superfamily II)
MNFLFRLLFGAFALAAPSHAAASGGHVERIEKVADQVWVIRQAEPFHLQPVGNVTLIEQSDGLVLIDAGGSPGSGRRIADLVRSVSARPVKAIVITHWHGDHTLGLGAIKTAWPAARVIATVQTRDALAGKPMAAYAQCAPDAAREADFLKRLDGFDRFLAQGLADPAQPPAVRAGFGQAAADIAAYRGDMKGAYLLLPDETFTERLLLADRKAPIELFYPRPANTQGDALAWLPRQKILVTGDVVVAPVPFGFNSHPGRWAETLRRLGARPFRILVPGHGAPQSDRSYLDRLVGLIEEVRRQVAPFAAAGLSLEETQKRVDLSTQRRRFVGDDPWLGRWFRAYWTAPFVESAWKEASGLEIGEGSG